MTTVLSTWSICVDTPSRVRVLALQTTHRSQARQQVRQALRQLLSDVLNTPEQHLTLQDVQGQALSLAPPYESIGLSVAHEAGLSLCGVNVDGAMGLDILRLDAVPSDWATIGQDYLGPARTQALHALPPSARLLGFAQAWTAHEAALKCFGMGLTEWSPALGRQLQPCRIRSLVLPEGYVGSIAWANNLSPHIPSSIA
jgi:4'-phosphopantetheinyl transferase